MRTRTRSTRIYTAVEEYKDGSRQVYHQYINDNTNSGYAWNHDEDKRTRAACSACTNGTLESVRGEVR